MSALCGVRWSVVGGISFWCFCSQSPHPTLSQGAREPTFASVSKGKGADAPRSRTQRARGPTHLASAPKGHGSRSRLRGARRSISVLVLWKRASIRIPVPWKRTSIRTLTPWEEGADPHPSFPGRGCRLVPPRPVGEGGGKGRFARASRIVLGSWVTVDIRPK